MSNRILPFSDKTLKMLKQKHPEANEPPTEILLQGPTQPFHPTLYEGMDESSFFESSNPKKGGSGPSGLDTDGWRKTLTSRLFGAALPKLRRTFALFVKRLCLEQITNAKSLESFVECRLVSLYKRLGLTPIGVGEVLRRIAGKTANILQKKDVQQVAGSLLLHQMYTRLFIIDVRGLYLKKIQHKAIQHRLVLLPQGYCHCFNFCSISFLSTNSTSKRSLLQMTLLANYQALKTTGANQYLLVQNNDYFPKASNSYLIVRGDRYLTLLCYLSIQM